MPGAYQTAEEVALVERRLLSCPEHTSIVSSYDFIMSNKCLLKCHAHMHMTNRYGHDMT
jgi:hypothetical protein